MLLQNGYKGFYSSNYLPLTPKSVNDIHKRGGTVLGTSRGGHDTKKIVDNIQDRGINQVNMIVHNALIDITLLFGKFLLIY
jgi:6-phosphofructokinase 1